MPAAPETVRLYLVDHAGKLSINTLRRRLSAISEAHVATQVPNPTVSPVVRFAWEGMRRTHGSAPRAKEAPVTEFAHRRSWRRGRFRPFHLAVIGPGTGCPSGVRMTPARRSWT
jgi:hypothetical protein